MKSYKLITLVILFTLALGACAPAATPTAPPAQPTQPAAQPTTPPSQPTEAAAPATQPPAEPTKAPEPPTAAPETKPVVVSVWTSDLKAVQMAADAYTKETGKKVIVQEIARDVLQEKEKTELTSKTGSVDVLWVPSEWVAELAEGGLLEPLDDYMTNTDLRQPDQSDWASPGSVEAYKYKGKAYGLPVSMDTLFLYYRKDLIPDPPQDWDTFLKVAQEQTKDGRYGTTVFGKVPESAAWDFINYFWSFGGTLIDDTFHPQINSKEGVAAMTYFSDLLRKYKVVPPGVTTYEYPEVLAAFQQDKVAMAVQWNAAYQSFADPQQSPLIYDKFAVTTIPGMKMPDGSIFRKSIGHVWGFVLNSSSTNKDEAYNFLVYLTSKDGLKFFPDNADSKNVNSKAILTDPTNLKNHPEYQYLSDSFKNMSLWPNTTTTSQIILELAQEASAALSGTKTPQQAMDDAQKNVDDMMKKAGYYQ
jgi:multiple sugar transport system substrate-binding protein